MPAKARSMVDLPEPDAPVSSADFGRMERKPWHCNDGAAGGQAQVQSIEADVLSGMLGEIDMGRLAAERLGAMDRVAEGGEAVDDGFVVRQGDVVVDEECQRAFDAAECTGRLREHPELHLAEEVERRGDHIGNDRADLAVGRGEGHQPLAEVHDAPEIMDHVAEATHDDLALGRLALEQGNLFGIFTKACEREAEVRLVALLRNFAQQRYEADFRFSLARLGDCARTVALLEGEAGERQIVMGVSAT